MRKTTAEQHDKRGEKMADVGLKLRQAREELNMTLEELSGRTHIAKKYLQALETGEYSIFPGEVYLKGALRNYAQEVGISAAEAIAWYEAVDTEKDSETAQETELPVKEQKTAEVGKVLAVAVRYLVIAACIVLLASAGRFAITSLIQWQSRITPPEPPPVVTEPDPVDVEPEPIDVEPQPEPLRVERDTDTEAVRYKVYNADSLEVNLIFKERCWVRVTADGSQIAEEIFSAGSVYSIPPANEVRVRVGNPPALSMEVNGLSVALPQTVHAYDFQIIRAAD